MYPASAQFKRMLRQNHVVISKAEIWTSDQKLSDLDVDSGYVRIDAKNATRRTCEVSLFTSRESNSLVPDNDYDLLTPFGNELRLYRGIRFEDGTEEYVPLGVFVMTEVNIKDDNSGVNIQVMGEDRSLIISRNKWVSPYQMTTGSLEDSLTDLLKDRYPDVITAFPTTNVSINQVVLGLEQSNDPWKDAVEIAELVGYDLFLDAEGVVQMNQFPSLDGSTIVASFEEGSNTLITSVDRLISTKETYNGVIYTIEGTEVETPIRVEAWDEDTSSPTYRFGKFGEVPIFINSSLLSTEAEAQSAALSLLNIYIGAQESIEFTSIVDPTLDVQDVIYVKAQGAKVDRLIILDSLTLPLSPTESLQATARTVRVVSVNEEVIVGA